MFDNEMLAQIFWHGFTIGEVSCPTKYFAEASSINLHAASNGFGCLGTGLKFRFANGALGLKLFPPAKEGSVRELTRQGSPKAGVDLLARRVTAWAGATGLWSLFLRLAVVR